jgi:hypothetical protein
MSGDKRRNETIPTHRRRRAGRPANVIAAIVGILAITLGVWALIKTGLNTDHIFTPTKEVLGLPHTPILALAEIGFGILLLFAAATGAFGTFLIAALGVASLAFGIIVLSDSWSEQVHRWTAADHDSGWLFILIGAVFVLAATLPLLVSTRTVQTADETATTHEPVAAEPEATPVEHEPATVSDPTAQEHPEGVPATAASQTDTETNALTPDASPDATG